MIERLTSRTRDATFELAPLRNDDKTLIIIIKHLNEIRREKDKKVFKFSESLTN